MRRVIAAALLTIIAIIFFRQPSGAADITITPLTLGEVHLDLVIDQHQLLSEEAARLRLKKRLERQGHDPAGFEYEIMTGLYFDPKTKGVGGLYARNGKIECPASRFKNRPVIMELQDGTILITTNERAEWYLSRIKVAIEVGPFLTDVEGHDWVDYSDIKDERFFDPTERWAIGLTADKKLLIVRGLGRLGEIRDAVRAKYPNIRALVNLDGGSSAVPGASLPSRLVAFWKKPAVARLSRRD